MTVSSGDFEKELKHLFSEAEKLGFVNVTINSGNLHKKTGGYLKNKDNRMNACCNVMRKIMNNEDKEISAPPKGNGAKLYISYKLPRTS